jgi:hypothetical protein
MTRTSRLELPSVTLVGLDLFNPIPTLRAMWFSMRQVTFTEAVIVTSRPLNVHGGLRGVRNLVYPHGWRKEDRLVREHYLVTKLHEAFTTPHCLHIEGDSSVANPAAWEDSWLDYDFIGAPWPWPYDEPGQTPCRAENCVGNTGFALMSRALCVSAAKYPTNDPAKLRISDGYLCRELRPKLEADGIRFAPEAVAERFSCENRIYSGQFGWHGWNTAKLNGFNLDGTI